ncbi:MAG: glycosyltransferase, partial [Rhodospirillaceae bacterium]|nr:glycosyltransferase [Rhodospirillaceae bacterium]
LAIGNGSDPGIFTPEDPGNTRVRIRNAIGTPAERVVILMTGRLVEEKGYRELVTAMRDVDAELWAVGARLESDHASGIADVIDSIERDPSLKNRVRFLGYRQDVPDLMRAADIFTLPSHREGMPRSIIEAMMVGLPVIATNIRGSREEVVAGETGLLVPVNDAKSLADAIRQLAGDPASRQSMGEAGRARAIELYDEAKVIARQMERLGLNRAS